MTFIIVELTLMVTFIILLKIITFFGFPFFVALFFRKMDWIEPFSYYCYKKPVKFNKKSKHYVEDKN